MCVHFSVAVQLPQVLFFVSGLVVGHANVFFSLGGGGSFRVGSLCYLSYSGQWSALCEFYGWCRDFASRGDVLCAVAGWCIVQIIFSDRLSPRGERWCLRGCIYVGVCVNCSPSLPTQIVRTPRPHGGFGSRSPT